MRTLIIIAAIILTSGICSAQEVYTVTSDTSLVVEFDSSTIARTWYQRGLDERPLAIVYMVPTDTLAYVNSQTFADTANIVLPKGAFILSKTFTASTRRLTISYTYPRYRRP